MIFFDPCSYTYHFNNRVLHEERDVKKLYSSNVSRSKLLKFLRILKFYWLIFLHATFYKPRTVVFNISPLPLLDVPLLLLLKIRRFRIVNILHNIDPSKGGKYFFRLVGFETFLNLFDLIVVHSDIGWNLRFLKSESKVVRAQIPVLGTRRRLVGSTNEYLNFRSELKFLFIGRIDEYKGIKNLGFYFQGSELSNVVLEIVGKPSYDCSEEIAALKKLGFKRFTFIDSYITDKEYYEYIADTDVVLLPYFYCSGSAVFTDAIEHGKVVLASSLDFFESERQNYSKLCTIKFFEEKFHNCSERLYVLKNELSITNYLTTSDYLNLLK
jgi:glycosyltransferase involved in cell wall biosynthesis